MDGNILGAIKGVVECCIVGASLGTALGMPDGTMLGSREGTVECCSGGASLIRR